MVILSGESAPEAKQAFIDAGAARVLLKPVSLSTISSLQGLMVPRLQVVSSPQSLALQPLLSSVMPRRDTQ